MEQTLNEHYSELYETLKRKKESQRKIALRQRALANKMRQKRMLLTESTERTSNYIISKELEDEDIQKKRKSNFLTVVKGD